MVGGTARGLIAALACDSEWPTIAARTTPMRRLLTFLFLLPVFVRAGSPWFSRMEDGDRIEVTQHSQGCFHDNTTYCEVKRTKGSYLFTEYLITWKPGRRLRSQRKKHAAP